MTIFDGFRGMQNVGLYRKRLAFVTKISYCTIYLMCIKIQIVFYFLIESISVYEEIT